MDFRFLPAVGMTGRGPEYSFDGLRVKVGAAFGENEKALWDSCDVAQDERTGGLGGGSSFDVAQDERAHHVAQDERAHHDPSTSSG